LHCSSRQPQQQAVIAQTTTSHSSSDPLPTCHPPGFVEPGATYRGDASDPSAQPALFRATQLSVPHSPADYEVKQVGGWIGVGVGGGRMLGRVMKSVGLCFFVWFRVAKRIGWARPPLM